MNIRRTTIDDLDAIEKIYAGAREQMKLDGNPNQWKDSSPSISAVIADIENGNSYVMEYGGRICAVFSFIIGEDATYRIIESGEWKNDLPYGTIHRIASDRTVRGVFSKCLEYCLTLIGNIRIDTHKDNAIMRHLVEKYGFEHCGIIYIADGSERIAYQKTVY